MDEKTRDPRTEIITPSGRWEDEGPPREMTEKKPPEGTERKQKAQRTRSVVMKAVREERGVISVRSG